MASPTVSFPAFRSRRRASTRSRSTASPDLFPLLELEHGAEGAAPLDLLADAILPLQDIDRAIRHLDGLILRHDEDPGFVADDPVARVHFLPAALDLAPDLAEAFRFSSVRRHVPAEAREIQLEDRVQVPHRPVDHDALDALHQTRVARELPPDGGRTAADVDHDHVAGFRAIDRLDRLGPVAIGRLHRDRAAEAPAAAAWATVSEFRPPATAMGSEVADATPFSSSSGVRAIICSSIETCMFR